MAKQFKLEFSLVLFGLAVTLTTPDWSITNPSKRPSWYPKWELVDWKGKIGCESRFMFTLTWFFHLTIWWGGPTEWPQAEDEETSLE